MNKGISLGGIRAILYTAQFEPYLLAAADRIASMIRDGGIPGLSAAEAATNIRVALRSNEPLAKVLPMHHDEQEVRDFLSSLLEKLE